MAEDEVKKKPVPSLKDWLKTQRMWNVIRVIWNTLILSGLIFWIVGMNYNPFVSWMQGFFFLFFLMVPLLVLYDAVVDSHAAYLDGKWEMKPDEEKRKPMAIKSHWPRVVPTALILGTIAAVFGFAALWLYTWIGATDVFPLDPWAILFMVAGLVFVPTWIIARFWIQRHLYDELASFTAALELPKPEKPAPFLRYFLWEHVFPWALILGIMNLGINLKGFLEKNVLTGMGVGVWDVTWSLWITALILVCWMFLSAVTQVRADVHLGRVKKGRSLSIIFLILTPIAVPVIAAGLMLGPALILNVTHLSVELSTILVIIDAVVCGVIGRWIGIMWGKDKEFAKIEKNEIVLKK